MKTQLLSIENRIQSMSICLQRALFVFAFMVGVFSSTAQETDSPKMDQIEGFSFFEKIIGQWEGPVMSNTPAGSFEVWYVDFRPVSASQVSQYSIMDANTLNYTSFFVVAYGDKLKIAMRTEGVFMNKGCVTYEFLDSVDANNGYYRFSDCKSGIKRAYTEFIFNGNALIMQTFTNKFNKEQITTLHSKWEAKLVDRNAADTAKNHLGFPKPVAVKDFSNAFKNMNESIYFTFENDPYPSDPQPYVGSLTVSITFDSKLKTKKDNEIFIVLSTKPIFEGLKYKKENLKYFSKYAFLPVDTKSFTFTNVHPGTYYLYSYNDIDNDKRHKKGDYMSSNLQNIVTVVPQTNTSAETTIDFVIP